MNVPLSLRPRRRLAILAVAALVGPAGCDGQAGTPQVLAVPKQGGAAEPPVPSAKRAGISDLEPGATLPTAAGQSIYLPIHNRIVGDDGSIRLTVNVAVRNTDDSRPILVTVVRHRDADGNTVRDYLAPRAASPPGRRWTSSSRTPDGPGPAGERPGRSWAADRAVNPADWSRSSRSGTGRAHLLRLPRRVSSTTGQFLGALPRAAAVGARGGLGDRLRSSATASSPLGLAGPVASPPKWDRYRSRRSSCPWPTIEAVSPPFRGNTTAYRRARSNCIIAPTARSFGPARAG